MFKLTALPAQFVKQAQVYLNPDSMWANTLNVPVTVDSVGKSKKLRIIQHDGRQIARSYSLSSYDLLRNLEAPTDKPASPQNLAEQLSLYQFEAWCQEVKLENREDVAILIRESNANTIYTPSAVEKLAELNQCCGQLVGQVQRHLDIDALDTLLGIAENQLHAFAASILVSLRQILMIYINFEGSVFTAEIHSRICRFAKIVIDRQDYSKAFILACRRRDEIIQGMKTILEDKSLIHLHETARKILPSRLRLR